MNPVAEVLSRLQNVKEHNGYFMAVCPSHPDNNPSLSISEGDDGRALIKCFAGCAAKDIVEAIGLKLSDLFVEGGEGGVIPLRNTTSLHHPPEKAHNNAERGDAAVRYQTESPPTLENYTEYVGLSVEFLKSLGLREIHYIDQKAVKIPYLDRRGEEVCVRFRVSLTGSPKVKTRKGDKHRLYGLQSIDEMKKTGYCILCEGESDAHVGWHHGVPVIGVPGAAGFKSEWATELGGFEKVYAIVEPDEAGKMFWERLAAESSLQERLYKTKLRGAKDLREMHLQDPAQFSDRLEEALQDATHWMDIAESEALERTRNAWEKCAELAAKDDILSRFYITLKASGVAGERKTCMILYLALVSRRLDRPVSIVVKGPSSGGKSFLVEKVAEYFPESAVYPLTAMSEKVLTYSEEPIKHRFLILYEATGMNSDFQTYLIRSLLSEGKLRYETVEKTPEGLQAKLIEREGPTGLIVTTTLSRLHPENETRMMSLSVTDTQEQTSQVLEALADEEVDLPDREEWVALQEWLEGATQQATIPFSKELAKLIPPVAVRLRRDFSAILNLIRAHALLHQHTREIDSAGRVVATVEEDYAAVRELVADLVAEGVDASVSETVKETVRAVEKLVGSSARGDDDEDGPITVSARQVAEELKLDKSATTRRLADALSKGYLKNLEDRRGRPGKYMPGDPLPADVVILPTVEELGWCTDAVMPEGIHSPSPPRRLTPEEVLKVRRCIEEGVSRRFAFDDVL